MRLFRPFVLFRKLFPEVVFRLADTDKVICLTFDDGPCPESTPRLLEILEKHGIKAVFFLNGRQAEEHPDLTCSIRNGGHITGNHGYDHLDGWRTGTRKYTQNVTKADALTSDCIFRPPYGRLTPSQYRILVRKYHIFLWDLMPYDFDSDLEPSGILKVYKKMIRNGSIVVLHDKPESYAAEILEEMILFASEKGYVFILPEKDAQNFARQGLC